MLDVLQISRDAADPCWCHCDSDATYCIYRPTAFITRQAGCTAYLLPFDTDMCCLLVTDAAQYWSQRSQMTFWIVFFFSHKALFVWRWPPMQPEAAWWSRGLLLLVFWDYIYLKQIVCMCMWEGLSEWTCVRRCACMCKDVHVDVHVAEDASPATHSPLDAFN